MKINTITNDTNYKTYSFKSNLQKNKISVDFNQNDMEWGSIAGGLVGISAAGAHLSKAKQKNLFKAGVVSSIIIAVSMFATIGAMSYAKIVKKIYSGEKAEKK